MSHDTCGCVVNSPYNHTYGARAVNVWSRVFFFLKNYDGSLFLIFFLRKNWENPSFLMRNVCNLMIKMINVSYLSEKVVVFVETKCLVSRNVNFELKYIKTDTSVSRQNTQKFSQSHSQCPTGTDRSDRSCFSSSSGSNPRSTRYAHMLKESRAGAVTDVVFILLIVLIVFSARWCIHITHKSTKCYTQRWVRPHGSPWSVCETTQGSGSVHLWQAVCRPSCDASPSPSLNVSTETLFQPSWGLQCHTVTDLLLCDQLFQPRVMNWNRSNGFYLREIQFTTFVTWVMWRSPLPKGILGDPHLTVTWVMWRSPLPKGILGDPHLGFHEAHHWKHFQKKSSVGPHDRL